MKIFQLNQFPDLVCSTSTRVAVPALWGEGNVMTAHLKTGSTSERTYTERPSGIAALARAERRRHKELAACKGHLLP